MSEVYINGQSACAEFSDFGASGNLGQNENDQVLFTNKGGFSSIGLKVSAPTGGVATFEATFDGTTWDPINLRSVDDDIYVQSTNNGSVFIGSISCARAFRVRTSTAGSAPGTVMGRAAVAPSTLEGQEFGNPPHRFGFITTRKDKAFTTAQTGGELWAPASGKRIVLTDIIMNVSGSTDGTVTIFMETDAEGNRLFKGGVNVSQNNQFTMNHAFRVPFESQVADEVLKLTTTANMTVDVMMHGYEV
jgi:hypothetical protein